MQRSGVVWTSPRAVRWLRRGWRIAAFMVPAAVGAQLAPDTPRLLSPHGSGGLGIHLLRPETQQTASAREGTGREASNTTASASASR